ncbi:MAG: CdaR family protein [Bdellovibrionales bacterium]
MKELKENLKSALLENSVAKLMALFIAFFLWATVMGRRDFVLTKVMSVELLTAENQAVVAQTADRVRVRVSGPRSALKKFIDDPKTQKMVLDISNSGDGVLELDIPQHQIQAPSGVKVLSIRPNMIRVEVTSKP